MALTQGELGAEPGPGFEPSHRTRRRGKEEASAGSGARSRGALPSPHFQPRARPLAKRFSGCRRLRKARGCRVQSPARARRRAPRALPLARAGGQRPSGPDAGVRLGAPHPGPAPRLTRTGVQGLGSHDQRRAHGVEGKFLKVVACLLGEDLVDHESLVAPPGCFELAGRAQPQLRVAVHGEPGPRPLAHRRGLCRAPRQPGGGGALEGRGGERAPGAPAARLDPPADQHLRRAFLGRRNCQSARALPAGPGAESRRGASAASPPVPIRREPARRVPAALLASALPAASHARLPVSLF